MTNREKTIDNISALNDDEFTKFFVRCRVVLHAPENRWGLSAKKG